MDLDDIVLTVGRPNVRDATAEWLLAQDPREYATLAEYYRDKHSDVMAKALEDTTQEEILAEIVNFLSGLEAAYAVNEGDWSPLEPH